MEWFEEFRWSSSRYWRVRTSISAGEEGTRRDAPSSNEFGKVQVGVETFLFGQAIKLSAW
jgi:hypothetical protein